MHQVKLRLVGLLVLGYCGGISLGAPKIVRINYTGSDWVQSDTRGRLFSNTSAYWRDAESLKLRPYDSARVRLVHPDGNLFLVNQANPPQSHITNLDFVQQSPAWTVPRDIVSPDLRYSGEQGGSFESYSFSIYRPETREYVGKIEQARYWRGRIGFSRSGQYVLGEYEDPLSGQTGVEIAPLPVNPDAGSPNTIRIPRVKLEVQDGWRVGDDSYIVQIGNRELWRISLATGATVRKYPFPSSIDLCTVTSDGRSVAVALSDYTLRIIDLESGGELKRSVMPTRPTGLASRFSGDTIAFFDRPDGTQIWSFGGSKGDRLMLREYAGYPMVGYGKDTNEILRAKFSILSEDVQANTTKWLTTLAAILLPHEMSFVKGLGYVGVGVGGFVLLHPDTGKVVLNRISNGAPGLSANGEFLVRSIDGMLEVSRTRSRRAAALIRPVLANPRNLGITPSGRYIFYTTDSDRRLTCHDVKLDVPLTRVDSGGFTEQFIIDESSNTLMIWRQSGNTLSKYRLSDLAHLRSEDMGLKPRFFRNGPGDTYIVVEQDNVVRRLDRETWEEVGESWTLPAGYFSSFILSPDARYFTAKSPGYELTYDFFPESD